MKWACFALPLLLVGLGLPLLLQIVPPNRWYGYRTALTFQDPAIWYSVNRETGAAMIGAGALGLLLSWGAFSGALQWRQETRILACLIGQALLLLLAFLVVVLRTERL